jgi:hypothetical protein
MIIDRVYVIRKITNEIKAKTYLEIGIREGECFLRIGVRNKIAVDPEILISSRKRRKYIFRDHRNIFNRYLKMTSDEFFRSAKKYLGDKKLDVVFIDGLHTYEQSLRDAENSLAILNDNGVIIMHDCNPKSEAAAHPALSTTAGEHQNSSGFAGEWNGDVWKTVVHLRSLNNEISVIVIDCDQGLGVIRKQPAQSSLPFTLQEIRQLSYKDLEKNRLSFLNLKTTEYLPELLRML